MFYIQINPHHYPESAYCRPDPLEACIGGLNAAAS